MWKISKVTHLQTNKQVQNENVLDHNRNVKWTIKRLNYKSLIPIQRKLSSILSMRNPHKCDILKLLIPRASLTFKWLDRIISVLCNALMSTHRIQDRYPVLHGDALEHGQHGQPDVIKTCYSCIWSRPLFQADRNIGITNVCSPRGVCRIPYEAWGSFLPIFNNLIWNFLKWMLRSVSSSFVIPTKVIQTVAGFIEWSGVELQPNNGKYEDSEEEKKRDVDKGSNGLCNGAHHYL